MSEERTKSNIPFVNLHGSHTTFSVFDGVGFPEDHMRAAWDNGIDALAITDHGNMNAFVYQLEAQKKLAREGKQIKNVFGAELYFIPSVSDWKREYEEAEKEKKKMKKEESTFLAEQEEDLKKHINSVLRQRSHILLLVQNQTGLNNIFQMISQSYRGDNFYRFPRIDFDLLKKHNEGLICSSACIGGFLARIMWQHKEKDSDFIKEQMKPTVEQFLSVFGERFFLEVQWNSMPEQHRYNQIVLELGKEYGIKVLSAVDAHYPKPENWRDREVYKRMGWLGMSGGKKPSCVSEDIPKTLDEIGYALYPKNGDQCWADYKKYSRECGAEYEDEDILETLKNTVHVANNMIEEFEPDKTVRLPSFVVPEGKTADVALAEMSIAGLKSLGKAKDKKYVDRLKEEIYVIRDRGFSKYFLTMKQVVDEAKQNGLYGPARGSAAGSLVAYVLGITQIDPIKWGLLFERFLRRDAVDYPDIDFDVSAPMELKEQLIEKWGKDTVVPISNFNTLQLRSLIKDISKLYDIPFKEVNEVTSKMMHEATPQAKKDNGVTAGVYVPTFEEVKKYSQSLQIFFRKYPVIEEHVDVLYGQIRSLSRHAGGVVIGEELNKHMPLINSKGVTQTPWTEGQQTVMHLEPMGFIKFDILGLASLRMIEQCIVGVLKKNGNKNPSTEDIWDYYNARLHPDEIDLSDEDVWKEIFHDGSFAGVFQCSEAGMQNLVKKAKPKSLEELSTCSAIYRPAALSVGVDKDYLEAKEDVEGIRYEHPLVKEVLQETYGFMIYQEQIALLVHKLGKDVTLDEGNILRKVIVKKGTESSKATKVRDNIWNKFVAGAQEKGMKLGQIEDLWQKMENFAGYGFNKCLRFSEPVTTYNSDGSKRRNKEIKDVKVGDIVKSRDEQSKQDILVKVVKNHNNGVKKVYKFTLDNGETIRCTMDHKFRVKDGRMLPIQKIFEQKLDIVASVEKNVKHTAA